MSRNEEWYANEDTIRPFRLWHATERRNLRWRNFKDKRRAHIAAMIEARWAKVGVTIEVYNCTNGKLLGQYTRTPTAVKIVEA